MSIYSEALRSALASGVAQTLPSGLVAAPLPGGGTLIAKAHVQRILPKIDRDLLEFLAKTCEIGKNRNGYFVQDGGPRYLHARNILDLDVQKLIEKRAKGEWRTNVEERFGWIAENSARDEAKRQARIVLEWVAEDDQPEPFDDEAEREAHYLWENGQ